MGLYGYIAKSANEGKPVKVDFKAKSIKVGEVFVMTDGHLTDKEMDFGAFAADVISKDVVEQMEYVYGLYKHSIPTEKSDNDRHPHFKALDASELSDDDWVHGLKRDLLKAVLESFVLCAYVHGLLDGLFDGKYFWQSEKDKDLVILADWFK